jgi:hypothetical protein
MNEVNGADMKSESNAHYINSKEAIVIYRNEYCLDVSEGFLGIVMKKGKEM